MSNIICNDLWDENKGKVKVKIPKPLPCLFLPNANLKPNLQECIPYGEVSQPRPQGMSKAKHRHHTLP